MTVTTYCGNLVAFLTFPTIEYPISDLNTLVEKVLILLACNISIASLIQGENQEVTWGLLGGSVIENYFEDAEEEKFRLTLQLRNQLHWRLLLLVRHIAEQAVKHNEADTVPSG